MGRYLLLAVLAASVGGGVLTLSTRTSMRATDDRHREGQADLLAREIAEAGHNLALREMVGDGGFVDPTAALGDEQAYNGGQFRIVYSAAGAEEATVTVVGMYGGAAHTTERTYTRDPMDAPGPLWLDVPFATASVASGARISGSATDHPVHLDRRQFDDGRMSDLFSLSDLEDEVSAAVEAAGSALATPEATEWGGETGLLEDLNVDDAEGLYQRGVSALNTSAGDSEYVGDWTVGSGATAGAGSFGGAPIASVPMASVTMLAALTSTPNTLPNTTFGRASDGSTIVHFDGDLTVAGRLSGHGLLLVNGALRVRPGATLDWDGIVVVRSTEMVLPIELDGRVAITGMMVVAHTALPPGGHLDMSVYRDPAGLTPTEPWGQRPSYDVREGNFWTEHTHRFDLKPVEAPRGSHVYYREGGASSRHEDRTELHSFLTALGGTQVYLTLGNRENHGHAVLGLNVTGARGTGGRIQLPVADGFGAFAAGAVDRSRTFAASDLRDLDVDVKSLRSLRKAFDDASCGDWPNCVGEDWDRRGALALRIHRAADGARLYESTLYWHLRTTEQAEHAAEMQALRTRIAAGEDFGTRLRMGDDVRLDYSLGEVQELGARLGFDTSEVRMLASSSSHVTAAEARAEALAPTDSSADDDSPETATVGPHTITATPNQPIATGPNEWVQMCHPAYGAATTWVTEEIKFRQVEHYLSTIPGARYGPCADHGL